LIRHRPVSYPREAVQTFFGSLRSDDEAGTPRSLDRAAQTVQKRTFFFQK